MTSTLTLVDETPYGKVLQKWEVPVKSTNLQLRELIMLRVEEEIRRQQDQATERYFTKLEEAPKIEHLLNGSNPLKQSKAPDPEAQGYRALQAFQKNAFFVLVNNQQLVDLEERVELRPDTTVSFVRLTPLVGG